MIHDYEPSDGPFNHDKGCEDSVLIAACLRSEGSPYHQHQGGRGGGGGRPAEGGAAHHRYRGQEHGR